MFNELEARHALREHSCLLLELGLDKGVFASCLSWKNKFNICRQMHLWFFSFLEKHTWIPSMVPNSSKIFFSLLFVKYLDLSLIVNFNKRLMSTECLQINKLEKKKSPVMFLIPHWTVLKAISRVILVRIVTIDYADWKFHNGCSTKWG
jgi:hypothetical protein